MIGKENVGLLIWLRQIVVRAVLRLRNVPREIHRRLQWRLLEFVDRWLISRSGLFDTKWYLGQNRDVAARGIDPLLHYLRHGPADGRDPNPWFDSDWYLAQNPDVAAAGINPLVHYLYNGGAEGRNPSPSFDARCYLAQNPDVATAGMNALVHFRLHGIHEGRVAPVATQFPGGLSFFRFVRRHHLGYVASAAE